MPADAQKSKLEASAPIPRAAPATARIDSGAVAVIIGNRGYQGDIPVVSFAHNDADAIKKLVIDRMGFDPENILDLRDAGKAALEATFGNRDTHKGRLWSYLEPDGSSRVFVYYSGHGVPGGGTGSAYLLPSDADPSVPEINGYSLDLLYENLGKLEARSVTVMLDTCFSGLSDGGALIRSASGIYVSPRMPKTNGKMTVLTAAAADQVASWDGRAQHGLFTRHLLDGLAGAADVAPYGDGDGVITAGEVHEYVKRFVAKSARRIHLREQTPTLAGQADIRVLYLN